MKNIYRLVFVLFTCLAAVQSCQDIYEEEYGSVELDYNRIDVKSDGGKYTFTVYCSGAWTISLDKDVDWVTFDRTSGSGVTIVNVEFGANSESQRHVTMTVSGGGSVKTVPVHQVGAYILYEIETVEDMFAWNQGAAPSLPEKIVLKNDISFSGQDMSQWKKRTFKGTFEGNNHKIDDFVLERDGEAAFFSKVEEAVIRNLTFGEGCSFTANAAASEPTYAASLAALALGNTSFENIINRGAVKVKDNEGTEATNVNRTGGICGSFLSTGSIDRCFNYGTVISDAAFGNWTGLGGIVGYVGTDSYANTITGCENHGVVTNTKVGSRVAVGGIVGFIQKANTTVTGCRNLAAVKNTGDAGTGVAVAGIVGRIEASTNGENTLEDNTNSGDVLFAGESANDAKLLSGVAGILGGHAGNISGDVNQPCKLTIDNCTNTGKVEKTGKGSSNMFVGGIAAFLYGPEKSADHVANISNCTNNTEASVLNNSSDYGGWFTYTGGIVAHHTVSGQMSGCKNYAAVTSTAMTSSSSWDAIRVGGIGGSVAFTSMENCTNYGVVSDQSKSNSGIVGGVVGRVIGSGLTMTDCDNEGAVSGKFNNTTKRTLLAVGGVVGVSSPKLVMTKCDNKGDVSQSNTCATTLEMVGGLIAYTAELAEISECSSSAVITSARDANYDYVGAFIGRFLKPASTITSSKVYGTFNGTGLSESNYTTYCFGTKSENKTTAGITVGEINQN